MTCKNKNPCVRLGQEAFVVVTADGEVERTMVGALDTNGYTFLNGVYCSRGHSFSLNDAIASAVGQVKVREAKLRDELRVLGRRRKYLQSAEYKDKIARSAYKVVDLRISDTRERTRRLKRVMVPGSYLSPGDRAYTIISPTTGAFWGAYRPYPRFVLEIEVLSVCFTPDGSAHYGFSTRFVVEEVFLLKDEAIKAFQSRSEPGTLESTPFVSFEEEEKKSSEIEDPPF